MWKVPLLWFGILMLVNCSHAHIEKVFRLCFKQLANRQWATRCKNVGRLIAILLTDMELNQALPTDIPASWFRLPWLGYVLLSLVTSLAIWAASSSSRTPSTPLPLWLSELPYPVFTTIVSSTLQMHQTGHLHFGCFSAIVFWQNNPL